MGRTRILYQVQDAEMPETRVRRREGKAVSMLAEHKTLY
jgi:hypothetical protein